MGLEAPHEEVEGPTPLGSPVVIAGRAVEDDLQVPPALASGRQTVSASGRAGVSAGVVGDPATGFLAFLTARAGAGPRIA